MQHDTVSSLVFFQRGYCTFDPDFNVLCRKSLNFLAKGIRYAPLENESTLNELFVANSQQPEHKPDGI